MASETMDIERVRQCLALVDQWRNSGLKAAAFEQQHQLKPGQLRGWAVHAPRWRARLAGQPYAARSKPPASTGFVSLSLPGTDTSCIRIECSAGPRSATLHWPVESGASCAAWLREFLA